MNEIEIDASMDETVDVKPCWPAGWFEETAGSIDDPTFVRPAPGVYETREVLE